MTVPALLFLLLLIGAASAALLQGQVDRPPIVDGYTQSHPYGGVHMILLRQEPGAERAVLPATLRVVGDRSAGGLRLLFVSDHSESELREMFPDALISADAEVRAQSTVWNLDRLDERLLSEADGTWTGPANGGATVTLYVVDSGVDTAHPEFGSRASTVFSAFGTDVTDSCGHGTHVAGIAAGTARGVAHGLQVRSVKVLSGNQCAGSLSGLADGLLHIISAGGTRVVINLSLGFYGYDSVIGALIATLIDNGVVIVAAAGNDASSACLNYPAAYPGVVSVAATNDVDSAAGFSNYGSCVDLYAPGVEISAASAGTTGYRTLSGTSMASPHVAAVAALRWQQNPAWTGEQVAMSLLQTATIGVVTNRRGSPDLLLFWSEQSVPQPSIPPQSGSSTTSSSSRCLLSALLLVACALV